MCRRVRYAHARPGRLPYARYDVCMIEISLWPILSAALAAILIGWVWYHPAVFGTTWMRMSNITPEMAERGKRRMPIMALVGLLAAMLVAYVMSYFGIAWGVYDWIGALQLGFWVWAGFVAPVLLGAVLWDQKPVRFYLINVLYWLVALIVMALILVLGPSVFGADQYGDPSDTVYLEG